MQKSENIIVAVRFRPLKKEETKQPFLQINEEKNIIDVSENGKDYHNFKFDFVFDLNSKQEKVFEKIAKNAVDWVCQGYNSTIFAYGSTGCLDPKTKVLLFSGGAKAAKDICIGDFLMGDDSTPRRVLKLFKGVSDMYDVVSKNGVYRVNSEHLLTLSNGEKIIDIEVKKYLKKSEKWKENYKGVKAKIEWPEKVNGLEQLVQLCNIKIENVGIKPFRFGSQNNETLKRVYNLASSLGLETRLESGSCLIGKFNLTYDIKLEYVGKGEYNGFLLDGNHRFLLADYTITHNSGKSYTMFGNEDGKGDIGIIPRACDAIFQNINANENVIEANMKCSFLEIYREQIRDLLTEKNSDNLKIRYNEDKGVYVQGLVEKYVYNSEEILQTIKNGAQQRTVAATSLNNVSSRSHAVLTLFLTQKFSDGSQTSSKLHLIDLAGSENVGKSEVQGKNLLEAQTINKSLSCLGNVIYALTEQDREHIPYRDSKLTYLLQDSLGGNSKTILIATASPASNSFTETLSTLKFSKRAKEIKNIPKINKNESHSQLLQTIEQLNRKIEELERKCEESKIIIEEIEKTEKENKEAVLLKVKCEQLEKKIHFMEDENKKGLERNKQVKDLFKKQRNVSKRANRELYRERIKNFNLLNELEGLRFFRQSIGEVLQTPEVIPLLFERINIEKKEMDLKDDNIEEDDFEDD